MKRPPLDPLALCLFLASCNGPDAELPAEYRALKVPEERLSSPLAREAGRRLFLENCALCHGERADGHGARREALSQKPADFTDAAWRARSSPRRTYYAIREGVPGTPMPAWKGIDREQLWDLVAYLRSVGESR
jgi:mono/diheme cytochrome c family protein